MKYAPVGAAWHCFCRFLSVFLVLVLLLRIVPLVDSIENFEALYDDNESPRVF